VSPAESTVITALPCASGVASAVACGDLGVILVLSGHRVASAVAKSNVFIAGAGFDHHIMSAVAEGNCVVAAAAGYDVTGCAKASIVTMRRSRSASRTFLPKSFHVFSHFSTARTSPPRDPFDWLWRARIATKRVGDGYGSGHCSRSISSDR
jgi:hypothetical protein